MKQACNGTLNQKGTDLDLPQNSGRKVAKRWIISHANKQGIGPKVKAQKGGISLPPTWPLMA